MKPAYRPERGAEEPSMDVTRRWRTRAAIAVMACALTLLRAAAGHAAIVVDSTTSASAHGQHPHVVPHRRRRPEARPGRGRDQPRWEQDRDGRDLRWNAPHAHRLSERTRKREPRRDLVPDRVFPRHGQRRRQPLGIGGPGRRRDLVQRRESAHAVRHLRVGPGDERVAKRLPRVRPGRSCSILSPPTGIRTGLTDSHRQTLQRGAPRSQGQQQGAWRRARHPCTAPLLPRRIVAGRR